MSSDNDIKYHSINIESTAVTNQQNTSRRRFLGLGKIQKRIDLLFQRIRRGNLDVRVTISVEMRASLEPKPASARKTKSEEAERRSRRSISKEEAKEGRSRRSISSVYQTAQSSHYGEGRL